MKDTGNTIERKTGITVLVCTYNGKKYLPTTLQHLAGQKVFDLEWEIILVDNASTDNSGEEAQKVWDNMKVSVPFTMVIEKCLGKDNAIDLGCTLAKYSYVIICDDDNWLNSNYVQDAFTIMKRNPKIGMLGGKGIPVFDFGLQPPNWFSEYKTYYAVGEQYVFNGEITHYWPRYRFIWGAGAVINLKVYFFLKSKGFTRILTYNKYPKVARSEDVELSLAIWLAGYKLWYDNRLTFEHYISRDKLQWSYLMTIVKQSISAVHYLRPYQILIFTGVKNAPVKSFWLQYNLHYLRIFLSHFNSLKDIKMLWNIIFGKHIEDKRYYEKVAVWYQCQSIFNLWNKYDRLYKKIVTLQKEISKN